MAFADGSATELRLGKESNWGTAPAAGTGRLVRRKTCDLSVDKDILKSAELLPHHQVNDLRHGLISNKGTLVAEPVPGGHSDLLAASIRKAFATGATTAALTNVTASATGPHFTRASGSFITDGFKVGDIVRWTGWTAPATGNNSRNYFITAIAADGTSITVCDPGVATATVTAKTAGDSVTLAVFGKKTFIPSSAHTDDSFAIERCYKDITQSEVYLGVKVGGFTLKFSAGAMGDLSIPLMGAGYSNATSEYYTTPTAVSTTSVLAGANGGLLIAGNSIAYVREMTLVNNNNLSNVQALGASTIQAISQGIIETTGSIVAYFKDAVMRDYFLNETEVSLVYFATSGTAANADFIQVCCPRVKFSGADKPDNPGVLSMTLPFQALYNGTGGSTVSSEKTTMSMQDSQAA